MSVETCPRCGEALPSSANFCPNCGAPVGVAPASERRVVTVVFVDLAGSTELAARLDPERFREVLAAFHGMVTDEITTLGGRAEGFIGDAVLGVFGVPVLHDDDALRGVRAGLEIVDRAQRLGPRLGLSMPVEVRVGVNTGQVAVGTAMDRTIVIGAEVNIGARLQQAAYPGEVLVGAPTRQLVGDGVVFGQVRPVQAKGIDRAMAAWPALSLAGSTTRRSLHLVNRRRELALLSDTFERVKVRERAHLVTLLGEPGIGKTRVVEAFLSMLEDDVKVLAGRSTPFEEEVTFWPLAQMVYREIGTDRSASDDEIAERLRGFAAEWVDDDDVDEAVRRLALALGVDEGDGDEGRYHAAEVQAGLLSLLSGIASRGPVVLVFEDLHEADPVLLDLIEQLVKEARKVPLMVLCVARWEFLGERPNWAGGIADAVTLWVEPLTLGHATELAMEAGDLAYDAAEGVAQHAGGNPYFVVEIAGMLRREERDLPPSGPAASARLLPATVQAVIAARIDQLSAGARQLVRHASVFPRGHFDLDELALIVEPRKELLAEAEDEELLVPDEDRPGVWRFGSDILRDVAYDSLAKRERQRLHLRVANKLSSDEHLERFPRTIAFHLEQAARAALDLNPRDRVLAERAVEALAHAGDIARRRIESRSAADLYERALALAGPDEEWGEREARILGVLGEARFWLGEFDPAEETLHRALALGAGNDRICAHASRFLADITMTLHGDVEQAAALTDRSLAAARRVGDRFVLARTLLMAAWVPFRGNELDRADAMFREALEVSRSGEQRDAWAESRSLVGIANVLATSGDEEEVLAIALEALAVGEDANQAFTAAVAHETVAASMRRLLRLDEGLHHAELAIRTFRELGARWELASALGDRAALHRVAGRSEEAEADAREAFVLCRDLQERALVTWTAAELARTLAMQGNASGAREILTDPAARLSEGEPGSVTALLAAESVLALAEGDRETARVKAEAAVEAESGPRGVRNGLAGQRWWAGRLFGPEAAGGAEVLEQARRTLEDHHAHQALLEPDLAAELGR